MLHLSRRLLIGSASAMGLVLMAGGAFAQGKYDPGASDTEIKIGHTNPYSGPASAYGIIGKTIEAYFKKINDEGGVNKRKITFITYDDAYSPPKTKELVRKLVEEDKVLFLFNTLGTPTNTMIWDYLNESKVPQLFVATGASKWGDPKGHPWTMGFQPDYQTEAIIYAKDILKNHPNAKIAVLYQNDDYGKDYLAGFKTGLGKDVNKIVKEASYEVADPTVDSQIIQLKDSGADVFFNITTPKFAAQAIKKAAELGWKPTQYLNNVSSSVGSVMKPAGYDNSQGLITALYLKDPTDKQWESSKDYQDWKAFMAKYIPNGDLTNGNHVFGYAVAGLMVQVLKQAGDDLTRANIMKQAASIKNFDLPMLLPGIKVNTSATDFYPLQSVQLAKFKGETWERFGEILSNEAASQ
jgi:ABC-type branched-subunit amino acid transport system substrate-binding protein